VIKFLEVSPGFTEMTSAQSLLTGCDMKLNEETRKYNISIPWWTVACYKYLLS